MSKQSHLVFGAGLIGGYIGGVFISRGINTTLLGRDKIKHALRQGLNLSDFEGHETTIAAPRFAQGEQQFDVIWVAVKCTAMNSVANELERYLKPTSTIICCQNGLGSDQVIRDAFPAHQVLSAIAVFNVAQISDNHLFRSTEGELIIESAESSRGFFDQVNCELLPARLSAQVHAEKWAKLQLNLANAVNALCDLPILDMLRDRQLRRIIAGMMDELLAVTAALNIDLPKLSAVPAKMLPRTMNVPDWLYNIIAKKVIEIDPKARMSMWWDLTGGRKTEIDFLNAAVVVKGKEVGVACPINERIVALIKSVERGEKSIGYSPTALSSEVLNNA